MLASLFLLPPEVLGPDAEPLVAPYAEHRGALLATMYLAGLAWSGAFLVFLAALHQLLAAGRDEATALLATVGLAGGIVNAAVIVLSVFFAALAVFRLDEVQQRIALLRDASFVANSFTGFATAVCVWGFTPALRRIGFPRWFVVLGALVGIHHLVSGAALAPAGLWSPSGAITTTAPLGMTLWVGSVAALTWRKRR